MDGGAPGGVGQAAESAPAAGLLGDFGLIDYESPAPDNQHGAEEAEPELALDPAPADGAAEQHDEAVDYGELGYTHAVEADMEPDLALEDADATQGDGYAGYDELEAPDADAACDGAEDAHRMAADPALAEDAAEQHGGLLDYGELEPAHMADGDAAQDSGHAGYDGPESEHAMALDPAAADGDFVGYGEPGQEAASAQEPPAVAEGIPETWVLSDGEWLLYLGSEQHSYTRDYQETLLQMPLSDLISVLQGDFALDEGVELALEFPSLALTIDQRDEQCGQVSLVGLYSCHVAVVDLGRLPLAYASLPYFSPDANGFSPPPASFSFVLHARPNVQAALQRAMEAAAEHATASADAVEPTAAAPAAADYDDAAADVDGDGEGQMDNADEVPDDDDYEGEEADDGADADADEHGSVGSSTAALLDNADGEDDDDDEDDDFVAEDDAERDHILSDDAVEEDEVEVVDDDDYEDDEQTSVGSGRVSPRYKRTKSQQQAADAADDDDDLDAADDAPAVKRARSDDDGEVETAAA
ncbi:hypothetical protein IWQ56_001904 [Coemansia nantahalensis]|uniref:Uncharacterized protein n=1 Tax=Coemansia nantahalensis TaxID=2789366 RepID=A0ACC1JYR2_9FUNG|nr:hypothetical protein IWQ57_002925 [Coemansia nantahalensis]KAJ2771132.1 hypothetical protein IWQ56_001904 [Coemansia nantahalensis]